MVADAGRALEALVDGKEGALSERAPGPGHPGRGHHGLNEIVPVPCEANQSQRL